MGHVAVRLALRPVEDRHAPDGEVAHVALVPGRDANVTPFARWEADAHALHLSGVAGGELVIEEAVLLDVRAHLAHAALVPEPGELPGVRALELEVWVREEVVGRIDLLDPAARLDLGRLEGGTVIALGVRLRVAPGAHEARDVVVRLKPSV